MINNYEDRRRSIEAQYLAALELLREGYRTKLAELDSLCSAPAEEPAKRRSNPLEAAAPPPPSAPPAPFRAEPVLHGRKGRAAAAAPRPRMVPGQVKDDLYRLVGSLPELFTNADIARVLGYKPSRGTLLRALEWLLESEYVVIEERANGRWSNTYRKQIPAEFMQILAEQYGAQESAETTGESAAEPSRDQT